MDKVIFLDRDGVLNRDAGYTHRVQDLIFLPNVFEGLLEMESLGYKFVIITNQSGIGRGYFSEKDFFLFQDALVKELSLKGITIQKTYFCPHLPADHCNCRKPNTGLIEKALREMKIDHDRSFVIGDTWTDIKLGNDCNLKTIYITGDDKDAKPYLYEKKPLYQVKDLLEAAEVIKKNDFQIF